MNSIPVKLGNSRFDKDFVKKYNELYEKYGDELARLNGLSKSQLDDTEFIDNFIDTNTVSDASIDGNANVSHKSIVTLMQEKSKPTNKLLAFHKIYLEIKKRYGRDEADEWMSREWEGYLYMHDFHSASYLSYCFSGDTRILTSKGVKRLDQIVGKPIKVLNKDREWEDAVVRYFGKREMKLLTLERKGEIKRIAVTGNHRWFVEDGNREIIGISTTDELKEGMFIPYNLPINTEEDPKYRPWVVKEFSELDRELDCYCAVVPGTESFTLEDNVLTHNCFAYDLKDLAEKGLFFLDNFNAEPPKHYITFIDFVKEYINFNANRTSGACGLPNLIPYMYYFWDRDVKDGYYTKTPEIYAKQGIQRFIYSINQPYVRDGIQSAFTNTSIFDHEYLAALFGGAVFPDGAFMIDEVEGIMDFQKLFLEEMSKIRSQNMMTFPVNSISLLRRDGKFVDEDFAVWACRHNMKWADSNLFIDDSVTSLSNCCRLKNNIDDLGYVKVPYYPFAGYRRGTQYGC